jgi:CBS domain-containing protein
VVEDGKVVGVLTLQELLAALSQAGLDAPVRNSMRADFVTATPGDSLDGALSKLKESECPVMPVVEEGGLVGLLTVENVGELVMIREAVRASRESVPLPLGPSDAADAMPREPAPASRPAEG